MTGKDDSYTAEETDQRLRAILRGAFSTSATPLAKIPTRTGKRRASKSPVPRAVKRAAKAKKAV